MKKTIYILTPTIVSIMGLILNFQKYMYGSPADIKNFIVTFLCMSTWIACIFFTAKSKCKFVLFFYLAFWTITLLLALLTVYVNLTDVSIDWAILFSVLFLGQFYGVTYLTTSFMAATTVIAIISFGMAIFIIILLKRVKARC